MKSASKKLLTNPVCTVGILFFIFSIILLLTRQVPAITEYNLYGYYNIFMYFFFILGIISICYFSFYFKIYALLYTRIRSGLCRFKDKTVRRRLFINSIVILGIICFSLGAEFLYGHFIIATPNTLGSYFNPYRFLFLLSALLVGFTLFCLRNQLRAHIERAFFIIAIICGSLMICSSSVNTCVSWDDHVHFNNVNSLIGLTEYSRTNAEVEFFEKYASEPYMFHPDYFNMKVQKEHIDYFDTLDNSGTVCTPRSYASLIQQICYIPAAFFLSISKLLGLPFEIRFAFGKFGSLLTYCIAIYFAIKKLKCGKMLMAGIALLPTNLFLAANYSYDYWNTALSLLGFAYFYSEMQSPDQKLSGTNAAVMIGALFWAFTPKAVYFPILALLYLMPKKKFQNRREYNRYIAAVTCAILYLVLSFVIPTIIGGPSTDLRGGEGVNGAAQVLYILKNPLEYTKTLLRFLKSYLSLNTAKDYATLLAYYGYGSKYIMAIFLVGLYAFLDRSDDVRFTSKMWHRIFTALCCFCSICLIATALYIAFTPVGINQINGCQPRYLVPFLFPILYNLGSAKKTNYFTKNAHYLTALTMSSYILLATFWTTCVGLYF